MLTDSGKMTQAVSAEVSEALQDIFSDSTGKTAQSQIHLFAGNWISCHDPFLLTKL